MNAWTLLILAGLLEVGFTTALKLEQKNKNYFWMFLVCAIGSFGMLSQAITTIPLGTAYAVWTGIGAVGTTLVGMLVFRDRATPLSLILLALAVLLIVLLKVTS
ncbi:DMT family transporter [Deinococcus cellulosilyticus]|uniref:QacE family quaternary ammonium compound efflux SMR transporter n=1 Tax=Deinococcus cellulosilyticus (strain DSM 18568 / NBRC 106333 / KACC 11606 / 5516J-15) TaxID=1223518 RepID=A0A511N7H2_DEIC1|nr:multidrug efflux SMR transporter [Deinococcus cellulosilyticus]GEM48361.1 QacE family quaternary ammonium compound efflux SMR transporter [Deinococcus cellulosilyticus NBRC 106333 = KACC 11606]